MPRHAPPTAPPIEVPHADPPTDAGSPARWRSILRVSLTVIACAVVWLALVTPARLDQLSPLSVLRIPLEALVLVAVLLAVPTGATRSARAVAATVGALFGVAMILKVVDLGFYQVVDRPARLVTDWPLLSSGLDYVSSTWGEAAALGVTVGAVLLTLAIIVVVALCAVRVGSLVRRDRLAGVYCVAVLAVAWVVAALTGAQFVPGQPVAAHAAASAAYDHVVQARIDIADQQTFARQLAPDRFHDTSGSVLLGGLRGKDVVFAFVESYGRVSLEDPTISPGVTAVLDAGAQQLAAAGFSARSGFLTSPTFGGGSWLAHSTLLSGTWIDSQPRYTDLLSSTRTTLVNDFNRAGWRTVADMPAVSKNWPEGAFYGYDKIYASSAIDYKGPRFSWSAMPDQFALSVLQKHELAPGHSRPVMATIELTSSHQPWAPLPKAIGWDDLGDGSVFDGMPEAGLKPADVWKDPLSVRAEYGHSIEYSISTLVSFLKTYGTDKTVLVFLGDHQPVPIVSGIGATHQVPITIVTRDPAVLTQVSTWGWSDGMKPQPGAPVWSMDSFRDRFLATFSATGATTR